MNPTTNVIEQESWVKICNMCFSTKHECGMREQVPQRDQIEKAQK